MPEFYKIRDTRTGLFSMGGTDTLAAFHHYGSTHSWDRYRYFKFWTQEGKTWNSLSRVKQHLTLFDNSLPKEWEVVKFEAVELGTLNVNAVR